MTAQKINTVGFLSEFERRHTLVPDRPFCWVLGSGASVQSGIPTGGALVQQWLKELHEMEAPTGQTLEDWATTENLQIKSFEFGKAANFANFKADVRKDYDEAERLYRRAVELDPVHANNTGNFALFMDSVRKDYDEAARLYRRAVELDAGQEYWKKQLARFLKEHPKFEK